MQKGIFMESHLARLVPCVLFLFIFIHLCLAAPGLTALQSEKSVDALPHAVALANPFASGEGDRSLLQSYIHSTLEDGQDRPEISTWEQEVFFLFRLYDYDRSGHLDGLEMMKLLSDYNSHHTPGAQVNALVVSMVDFLLQTQDSNQDGLLAPSELLSPPLTRSQDPTNNNEFHPVQQAANPITDEERARADEDREVNHEELLSQDEIQTQPEVETQKDEPIKQVDNQHGQPLPEVPVAGHKDPVHVGQPEI